VDAFDLPALGQDAEFGLGQQVCGGGRQRAEAVDQLLVEVGQALEAPQAAQAAVELDLDARAGDVVLGQIRAPRELDRAGEPRPRSWCRSARPYLSASLMKIVFTLGMSSPDSMIVVATRMSNSRRMKASIVRSSVSPLIWPCATAMRASGTIAWMRSAVVAIS